MTDLFDSWKHRVKKIKIETHALYLAYRDPRVPWSARILIACVVGYALSPIDLIPDFIPILGYLDDLIIVPLGLLWAIKLVPPDVLAEYRLKAEQMSSDGTPRNRIAAVIIVLIWMIILFGLTKVVIGWI